MFLKKMSIKKYQSGAIWIDYISQINKLLNIEEILV